MIPVGTDYHNFTYWNTPTSMSLRSEENEVLGNICLMAARKSSIPNFQAIDDSVLGEYSLSNYSERLYSKVYYSIRSLCGLLGKRSFQDFNWDTFKERFASDFGKVEEQRFSLEQLLEFAICRLRRHAVLS